MFKTCSISRCAILAAGLAMAAISFSGAQAAESTVYTFTGGADGGYPVAGLTEDKDGNFYGATSGGGASGNGAIYKIAPDGTETVLYSFAGGSDGVGPQSAPIVGRHGNLYGVTTYGGGSCNCGTVYKITRRGKEKVLHTFTGQPDGFDPYASPVMDKAGNLYGTTLDGGTYYGTVYKIAPDGTETILYTFGGGTDGNSPYPGVTLDKDGNLYGATSFGGAYGFGTVFKLTPEGTKTILYNFAGQPDVASPSSTPILDRHGAIYGIGRFGGAGNSGAVYKINGKGKEKLLHSFARDGVDGYSPGYGLIRDKAGNLYGTTTEGGSGDCGGYGCGTIFKLARDGTETILYSFTGGDDGSSPYAAPVLDATGTLLGTANYGGADGYGVVYELSN